MTNTKTMTALIKREFLEGKNGYFWTPVIIAAVALGLVLLSSVGIGDFGFNDGRVRVNIDNLGDLLERARSEATEDGKVGDIPATVTLLYSVMSSMVLIAMPFAVFFSLLGSLYEERRDKSILFWKSMPVSDWQEVAAKLVTIAFGVPFIYLGVMIVTQVCIALLISAVSLVQGGPVIELWPILTMVTFWYALVKMFLFLGLWGLPIAMWLLFVSAYASRMPFLFAVLPIVVLIAAEAIVFESASFGSWVVTHIGGWFEQSQLINDHNIDGPKDALAEFTGVGLFDLMGATFLSVRFWLGIVVAAGLFIGTVSLRKRAI